MTAISQRSSFNHKTSETGRSKCHLEQRELFVKQGKYYLSQATGIDASKGLWIFFTTDLCFSLHKMYYTDTMNTNNIQ